MTESQKLVNALLNRQTGRLYDLSHSILVCKHHAPIQFYRYTASTSCRPLFIGPGSRADSIQLPTVALSRTLLFRDLAGHIKIPKTFFLFCFFQPPKQICLSLRTSHSLPPPHLLLAPPRFSTSTASLPLSPTFSLSPLYSKKNRIPVLGSIITLLAFTQFKPNSNQNVDPLDLNSPLITAWVPFDLSACEQGKDPFLRQRCDPTLSFR